MQFTLSALTTVIAAASTAMAAVPSPKPNPAAPSNRADHCTVVVHSDREFVGEKEGFRNNFECINLGEKLAGSVSSYEVSGKNCACSFYEDVDCAGFRFDATNRNDADLEEHGDDNDDIKSIKCRRVDEGK